MKAELSPSEDSSVVLTLTAESPLETIALEAWGKQMVTNNGGYDLMPSRYLLIQLVREASPR